MKKEMNFLQFRFETGGLFPYEFYRKQSNGRVTYHRYTDNGIVNPKHFSEEYINAINKNVWDNNIDSAKKYAETVKEIEKTTQTINATREHIEHLKSQPKPEQYELHKQQLLILKQKPYYYKMSSSGTIKYYSNITEKIVKKQDINVSFDSIPIKTDKMTQTEQYDEEQKEIPKYEKKLIDLEQRLESLNQIPKVENYKVILQNHDDFVKRIIQRIKDDKFKVFQNFMSDDDKHETEKEPKKRKVEVEVDINVDEAKKILTSLNIHSKLEWKQWLAKNHSDKGGSNILTRQVIETGKIVYEQE